MSATATTDPLPIQIEPSNRLLTAAEFQKLADVPPEVEWFANISNHHTRRAQETRAARCSGRSATTAPGAWSKRSPRTACIGWCEGIRGN
jgi:hypothetical protein